MIKTYTTSIHLSLGTFWPVFHLGDASNRCAQMGRPLAAIPQSIAREIENWINRISTLQAIAICPKCAGLHDPAATPERGTLALDPSDSHPLRQKCSKCKKHLAAESQLKTAVVIAEVPFLPEQTDCPCNPDEFLALSNTTANIKDELNETWQILQTTRDERNELQLKNLEVSPTRKRQLGQELLKTQTRETFTRRQKIRIF